MKTKNHFKFCLLFFFLISLFLASVWFRKGLLLGGGEAGIPFYDPGRMKRLTFFSWTRGTIGKAPVTGFVSSLFNWPAQILIGFGLPQPAVQGLYFFLFLFTEGLGVLLLTKEIFRGEKKQSLISLTAALFYMLNPVSLMGVWHRFQFPFMCFYSLMPLALFLFIRGVRLRKLAYGLVLNIVCLIFSTAFVSLPLLELFWLVIGSYLLFYLLTHRHDKQRRIFAFKFFFLTFFLWLLLNLWWLFQFINVLFATKFITTQAITQSGNIGTFRTVSERLGRFLYLFRLHHKNFFENLVEVWGPVYFTPLFLILGFLGPIFALGSFLARKKPKLYWYFALLSILGFFFTKGSAPPLGQIFLFVFSRLRVLEGFRNPLEKIGLILPLGLAPLFGLGLISFYSYLKKFNKRFASCLISPFLFLAFVVYMFPMWNGWLFLGTFPPTNDPEIGIHVKVPEYYEEANQWLNRDRSDFRAVALPIGGEGINHKWEYGYNGIELSHTLFDKPFVSLATAIPYLKEVVSPMEDFFLGSTERFYGLMGVLNSKYLMVRSDINYEILGMKSPEVIKKGLKEKVFELGQGLVEGSNLELAKKFGELEFWKVPDEFFVPHFYVADSGSLVDKNLQNPYTPLSFDDFELREAVFSSDEESGLLGEIVDSFYISGQPHPVREIRVTELGAGKFLPGSKLYPFVQWKEGRAEKEVLATDDPDKIIDFHLGLASKRLGEVEKLMEKASKLKQSTSQNEMEEKGNGKEKEKYEKLVEESWERFWERLDKAYQLLKGMEEKEREAAETAVRILEYVRLFQGKFSYFLSGEGVQADISDKLKKLLILRYQLEQKAWITHDELEKRYFIEAPETNNYEFFVKEFGDPQLIGLGEDVDRAEGYTRLLEADPFKPMSFALNDNLATVSGQKRTDSWLSFGNYQLEEGKQKLRIFLPRFINLAKQENFTLSGKQGQSLVLPLNNFLEQGRSFNISFNYRIRGENRPRIIVAEKVKIEGEDKVRRIIDTVLPKSEHELQFIKSFAIHPGAKEAGVTIFFEEYGDSEIEIGNFQVTRDWRPTVVFRATTDDSESKEANGLSERLIDQKRPKITFQRVNPTRYEVEVEEAEAPYLLVFSESFHPGWGLYLDRVDGDNGADGEILASYFDEEIQERQPRNDFAYQGMFDLWGRKEVVPQERHLLANGYANSWLIKPEDVEGKGSYKLIVEFWPQRLFYLGLFISGMTFLGCLGYLGYNWLGKRKEGKGK